MISESDKNVLIFWAQKYNVRELFLFGSSLEEGAAANDIDIAVRGIPAGDFFDFYGKLLRHLSKPVDVVNLANVSRFTQLIEKKGVKIYELPKSEEMKKKRIAV